VGAGLRGQVKLGASGKLVSASAIAQAMALGADWCNSARGFMFAVGCIQSQRCNTNKCPVGVTTQNPRLQRALVVDDKSERVHRFHQHTVNALAEMVAAMGLDHCNGLRPHHVAKRVSASLVQSFSEIYERFEPDSLLNGSAPERAQAVWDRATPEHFLPPDEDGFRG
ncbi:MAG: glutamate synthase-related protein, partial [Actinomycetota bacterium]